MSNEALLAQRREMRQEIEQLTHERDAALADLRQARAERDEHKTFRDVNEGLLKDAEALCRRLFTSRDAAIARAEAAEAQAKGANTYAGQLADDAGRYMRELEAERAAHAATKAKLGRAVAALQECGATIYASTDSYKELWRRAEIARAAIADSAAAGEAYKREREERDSLKAEIAMLRGVDCGVDGDGPCGVCIKCARNSVDWCDAKFNGQGDE